MDADVHAKPARMSARDWDYFILRCLVLGYSVRAIAKCIGYQEMTIRVRMMELCHAHGVRSYKTLLRKLAP